MAPHRLTEWHKDGESAEDREEEEDGESREEINS